MSQHPSPIMQWIEKRAPFIPPLCRHFLRFPMPPVNLWWGLGACLIISLVFMGLSGLFLAINYTPDTQQAFKSIETISRRIPSGWFIRSLHMGGATMLFAALYLHIGRGLWYGSYKAPRELVWFSGLILMLLFMVTAFAGYVLPWGQMSYWGATVITHAIEALPGIGHPLITFLLGSDHLGTIALHRFFILHFALGFIIVAIVGMHIIFLHGVGPSNPTEDSPHPVTTTRPFHPYYTVKDSTIVCLFLIIYTILIFFLPDWIEKSSNVIPANPLKTPNDITPEWYLAFFYAILRAIPFRLGGVLLAALSVLILFALPWLDRSPRHNARYRPYARPGIILAFISFVTLTAAGIHPPSLWWLWISRLSIILWFGVFLLLLPFSARQERASLKEDES